MARTAVKRWRERCSAGHKIPKWAIVTHRLKYWFKFAPVDDNGFYYIAIAERI